MTLKIVAVFPEGGDAAKNEKYVNCTENALGLRDWCKQNDADLVVTSSKDGSDSGEGMHRPCAGSTSMYMDVLTAYRMQICKFQHCQAFAVHLQARHIWHALSDTQYCQAHIEIHYFLLLCVCTDRMTAQVAHTFHLFPVSSLHQFCCRAGQAPAGCRDPDHHSLPPSIHDQGKGAEGRQAEADHDSWGGFRPH